MGKRKDLQPWLDYFAMLHTYEQKGFLEMKAAQHEAYVTRAAFFTLVPGTLTLYEDPGPAIDGLRELAVRLSRYGAFLAAQQRGLKDFDPEAVNNPDAPLPDIPEKELTAYFSRNFAVHVVKEEPPHDLLCTLLLSVRRRWWKPWEEELNIEVISYGDVEEV